jgi:hypothetical protein
MMMLMMMKGSVKCQGRDYIGQQEQELKMGCKKTVVRMSGFMQCERDDPICGWPELAGP